MTTFISNNAAKAACDAIVDLLDVGGGGSLKVYAGSVPTDADTALGVQTLLGTLPLTSTAFGNAADANPGGRATAATITSDTSADATGTASFYRAVNAAGACVIQGSVGTSGAELNLNSVSIQSGGTIAVSSWTFTVPET